MAKARFRLGIAIKSLFRRKSRYSWDHVGFSWFVYLGDTAYESYVNSLDVIEACAEYLAQNFGKTRPVFGGQKIESLPADARKEQAAQIAPILRGFCSSERHMIGHFTDDEKVLEYINSNDLERLAPLG